MLDAVVRIEVGEVERVRPVAPAEHVRRVLGHEEAKRRRKVVSLLHERGQLAERDVASRVREDACIDPSNSGAPANGPSAEGSPESHEGVRRTVVGHRVERGTRASAITLLRWNVLRPLAIRAGVAFGHDVFGRTIRCDEIVDEEDKVDQEDE